MKASYSLPSGLRLIFSFLTMVDNYGSEEDDAPFVICQFCGDWKFTRLDTHIMLSPSCDARVCGAALAPPEPADDLLDIPFNDEVERSHFSQPQDLSSSSDESRDPDEDLLYIPSGFTRPADLSSSATAGASPVT